MENPEELRDLAALEIRLSKSGYLHVYIANTSAQAVNWDELALTRLRGQVLEINHYYPYGLQLFGIDNEGRSYPYKYGSKELQQDEWARRMVISNGFVNLDWLDFEARMYDPTVARWYNPDPAEQFLNPYLAMGNNPVVYVDPDGEFVFIIPHISFGNGSFDVGLTVGIGFPGAASVQVTIGNTSQQNTNNTYVTVGGTIGGVTASVGYGSQTGYTAGIGFGFGFGPPGLNTNLSSVGYSWSQNYGSSINAFGTSITSGGFGFDPSIGYSTSYIPGRKGKVVPALYACKDCAAEVFLAEYQVIGQRDPYFGPFKHNDAARHASSQAIKSQLKSNGRWSFNFGSEVTVGVQAGGGAKFQGLGPNVELNLAYLQLLEFGYSSTEGGFAYDHAGKKGLYHIGNNVSFIAGSVYQTFDTRGTGSMNHQTGGSLGPIIFGSQGYGLEFSISGSFIIGARLNFSLVYQP